jgi:hypothetical protein
VLPVTPTDGQIFIDAERIKWIYNADNGVWDKAGTVETAPLANSIESGLMSSADKRLLDGVPIIGGGFGLIADSKLVLHSNSNPSGILQGNIKLVSDSLDIICVDSALDPIPSSQTSPPQVISDEGNESPGELPGLMFKPSEKFLKTLMVDRPGPDGQKGLKGDKGTQGRDGLSDGPVGKVGKDGVSITEKCELVDVTYEDVTGTTTVGVVDISVQDNCELVLIISPIGIDGESPSKVIATPIDRSVVYEEDDDEEICDLARLDDWRIAGGPEEGEDAVQLLRLADGNHSSEVAFSGDMTLVNFVEDVVEHYKSKLISVNDDWGEELKEYIESVDDKARTIVSTLANQVSTCEFNLPAVEYCITIECPPTSPSAVAAFGAQSIHNLPVDNVNNMMTLNVGSKRWQVKS